MFRRTCFGMFLDVGHMNFSGQLVHQALLRQVVTSAKKESGVILFRFKFAGKRATFSVAEFALITGLLCGDVPPLSSLIDTSVHRIRDLYFGGNKSIGRNKLDEVFMSCDPEPGKEEDVLKLDLVYFLESVLLPRERSRNIDIQWLQLVDNVNVFNKYPWGSMSYARTAKSLASVMIWLYEAVPRIGMSYANVREENRFPRILNWSSTATPESNAIVSNIFDMRKEYLSSIGSPKLKETTNVVGSSKTKKKSSKKKSNVADESNVAVDAFENLFGDEDNNRHNPEIEREDDPMGRVIEKLLGIEKVLIEQKKINRLLRNEVTTYFDAFFQSVEGNMKTLVEFRIGTNMEVDDEVLSDEIEPQNKGLENKENDAKEEEDKVEENEEKVENEEKEDDVVQVKENEEKEPEQEEEEEVEKEEAGVQIKENEEKKEKDENEEAVVGRNDAELPSMELEAVDELLELSKHRFTPEKINKDSEGVEEIRESQFPTATPGGTRKYTRNKNKRAKRPGPQTKTPFTSPSFKRRKLMVENETVNPLTDAPILQLKRAYPKEWARDLLAFMKDNTLESKLISWEPCQVDKNWFVDAIRPETWLSDKHLYVAMYHIRRRIANNPEVFKKKVRVTQAFILFNESKDCSWDNDNLILDNVIGESPVKSVSWSNVDYVYFPANFNNAHWVVVEMILGERQINDYDLLTSCTKIPKFNELMQPLKLMMPYILRAAALNDENLSPWKLKRVSSCPQQNNVGDCGMFTIKFIEVLTASMPVSLITQEDMVFYRKKFTMEAWGGEFLMVGIDHVDLSENRRCGIAINNSGVALAKHVPDYAIDLLIYVLRRVSAGDRYVRTGFWASGL
ncbi:uncharacterized protein LOC119986809 [Tripterygium wilfordii]|uniref:uncharacterized protein LOC119986809 n=1 Tax=Tripterygium wilfordii TaxID=458696 RepID=UPI0018F7F4FE|nr:uncharacterized protein LOC119986809 [Tripterygium wilfordii]